MVLLGGAAFLASATVLAVLWFRNARLSGAVTAMVAVATLAPHVALAPARPLVAVMLALSAASAWGVLVAAGLRTDPRPELGGDISETESSQPSDVTTPGSTSDAATDAGADPTDPPTDPRVLLVDTARQLVPDAEVSLVEPDGTGNLVISASTRDSLIGFTFPADSTSASENTYRTGRRLYLADPRSEPLVNPTHLERTGAASMLWQPVRVDDVPSAVLVVGWAERADEMTQRDIQAINLLVEEAAGFLAQESLRADLEHFRSTDVLTGLDSRAAWDAQLDVLMGRCAETGQSVVVGIINLDHFRAFNAINGQAAGDAHLARFARAARGTLRSDGLLARWGGEEFAVGLTALTPEAAYGVLDRVRLAVPDGRTCSIGFAVWDHRETLAMLLSRADRGLHVAKDAGRNRICQAS
jgi:diguanylate cyclase (GGDEF)-like protein